MSNYGVSNINGNIELTMPLKIMTFTGIANQMQAENTVPMKDCVYFFYIIEIVNEGVLT